MFLLGMMIGALLGMGTMCLITSGRDDDYSVPEELTKKEESDKRK